MSSAVSLWAQDGKYIDGELRDDQCLQITGQILGDGDDEYEFALTVSPEDVEKVRSALGGDRHSDVLALLKANAEMIVSRGEQAWLESIGVEPELWNRMG